MVIIQVVAALLLLLGSGLIFKALLEVDAPSHPHATARPWPRRAEPDVEIDLPRAA